MKITKFGHACLLLETEGLRILTDPGNYSEGFEGLENLDFVVLTHEHLDHVDPATLAPLLSNNPGTKVITNKSAQDFLTKEGVKANFQTVEDGETYSQGGLMIEGCGRDHAVLHSSIPCIHNTGYFIGSLFHPGDAFPLPAHPVDILALPVAAPWMRVAEAINYALLVKPQKVIAIHDGTLRIPGGNHRLPKQILEPAGIPFLVLEGGKEYNF